MGRSVRKFTTLLRSQCYREVRTKRAFFVLVYCTCLSFLSAAAYSQNALIAGAADRANASLPTSAKGSPHEFIENRGQLFDQYQRAMPEVAYYAESHGVTTYFTKHAQYFVFSRSERKSPPSEHDSLLGSDKNLTLYRAGMTFVGASSATVLGGLGKREDYLNFYLASCPNGLTNVPTYDSLYYKELYPHIDLVIRVEDGGAEYEFIVHPGGRVSDIRMQYDSRERLELEGSGALHVSNTFGEMIDPKPISFQSNIEIESAFRLSGNTVTYQVGEYDHSKDLMIDPPRVWGTYYGGSGSDNGAAVASDASGNVYVTGSTTSSNNIATTGAFQTTYASYNDVFVVKLNSSGVRQWGTYVGNGNEYASSIVVDRNGDVIIAGTTESYTTISTTGAYQTTFGGESDAYLMKFTSSGSRSWGTYYGSIGWDRGFAVNVDASNNILLGGTVNGYNNFGQCLVAKFNSAGTSVAWSTTWGGHNAVSGDAVLGLTCDGSNNVYVTGAVNSATSFATAGSYQSTLGGNTDAFVAKLTSAGVISWCTYYGGTGYEYGNAIATDGTSLYTTGWTSSSSAIATSGAYQTSFTGSNEAYLAKWNYSGSLQWGTYYGNGLDNGNGVAIDSNKYIIFCGSTASSSGIATTGEYQTTYLNNGIQNAMAYAAEFDSTGSRQWGTYYGTGDEETGQGIAIDPNSNILMTGYTQTSSGSLATSGTAQTSSGGGQDAFIVKFCGIQTPSVASSGGTSICQGTSTTLSVASGYSSYQWKLASTNISGATSNSYTVPTTLSPGTYNYTVSVTNSQGCSVISPTRQLTVNSLPTATAGTNYTICLGDSITIGGVATGGQSPYTYAWSPGSGLSSATAASPKASPASTTTYAVTVTDANGCQGTASVVVTVNPVPTLSLTRHVETCAGTAVTIGSNASGSAAPYAYAWSPSAGLSSTAVAQPSANPAAETKYFVTVTDANGCHTFDSVDVVVNPLPVLATSPNVSICQGSSTPFSSSTTGGTGSLTYGWTPGTGLSSATIPNPVASPSATTTYQLTVTDAKGCTASSYVTVTVNKHPVPVLLPGNSIDLCEGDTVMLRTQDPYPSYLWSNGATTDSIAVTQSGTYSVSVVDMHGCDGVSPAAAVKVHARPLAVITGPDAGCPNSTAEYHAPPQNGVEYQWTLASGGTIASGATDSICSVQWSSVGTWKIDLQVTDTTTGCSKDTSYAVSVNSVLTPALTLSGPTTLCQGDTLTISAPAGYSSYKWSSGQTTNSIMVSQSGSYSVQVTNASGCSGSSQAVNVQALNVPKPTPSIVASASTVCDGDSVLLTASAGYAAYLWSDGSASPSIYVHTSGNYFVTATNASGCQGTSPVTKITVLPSPPVVVTPSGSTTICAGASVTLTASAGFSKYQWSNGATTQSVQAVSSGAYSVTVTNQNGCTRTSDPVTVTVVPVPAPIISGPIAACANSTETYSVINIPGSTVQWRVAGGAVQGGQGTNSITVLWGAAGSGSVDADQSIAAIGCEGSAPTLTVAIGTSLKPVITTAGGRTALCGTGDSLTLDAGSGYAHYTWSSGQTSQQIVIYNTGSYTVSVDDGAGCSGASDPIVITSAQPPQPTIQSNGPLAFCEGDSVTLDAGAGFRSYLWSVGSAVIAGATGQTLTVRQSGTYAADVTNAAGCSATSPGATVTVYPLPAQPTITESNGVLSSSPAQAYQWSLDGTAIPGATTQTTPIAASGTYTVTITDANGCESESLPYVMSLQGFATISLPSIVRVAPNTALSIPLVMSGAKNLSESGATTFAATLRVRTDLLTPTAAGATMAGTDWIVPVSGPLPAASDTLLFLTFTSGTEDPDCGPLSIDTVYFPNAFVKVTSGNAEVCVAGVCTPWVQALDTGLYIRSILPNPSNGSFSIAYHLSDDGPVSLVLEDMVGRTASVLKRAWGKAGTYQETYDVADLPTGVYRLNLYAGARAVNKMVEVAR